MLTTLGSIQLAWSPAGEIHHQCEGGFADRDQNITEMLLPSLAAWMNHQLSISKPSHGLLLCRQAMDYIQDGNHTLVPINPVLKSGRLSYVRDRYGVRLRWSHRASLFATSTLVEEGARQAFNNYIPYVFGFARGAAVIALRQAVSVVVSFYLEFLEELRKDERVGPQRDLWTPYFSQSLSCMTYDIIRVFEPRFENEKQLKDTLSSLPSLVLGTKGHLAEITNWMGVLN